MASFTGSTVRSKTLKERATQIDASRFAVSAGKAGEIQKRKKVAKVHVRDGGACGKGHEDDSADDNSPSGPPADTTTQLLTQFADEGSRGRLVRHKCSLMKIETTKVETRAILPQTQLLLNSGRLSGGLIFMSR
jgi:hypothetical protein